MTAAMEGHENVVRAESLHRRDEVLLFGQLVEIFDVQPVVDFPTCVNLVIRPRHGGQPRETLVPRGMMLLGMRLPRLLRLSCAGGCGRVARTPVDLAQGPVPDVWCPSCLDRIDEESTPPPFAAPPVPSTAPWFASHAPAGRY
ncbi:hypothetical protein [Micromonospora cathayae]|uniref:Uncharacterized protein n=1 Tax=Micromonospora cathayae TaxID=3028804 RepID=A0ABY7ZMM7_9ACTN|nr:hypothetical protein [Micromonospora sp. HUAS 3]WDZ84016.1 hypothetical protein PVK37_26670 [Micromonospora sp. HUAS 3]